MIHIQVNRETCNGYANCVKASAAIFDVDDEGLVVLNQETVEDDQLQAVRRAAYDCPTDSISFTEE
jgi:ferredoxin